MADWYFTCLNIYIIVDVQISVYNRSRHTYIYIYIGLDIRIYIIQYINIYTCMIYTLFHTSQHQNQLIKSCFMFKNPYIHPYKKNTCKLQQLAGLQFRSLGLVGEMWEVLALVSRGPHRGSHRVFFVSDFGVFFFFGLLTGASYGKEMPQFRKGAVAQTICWVRIV